MSEFLVKTSKDIGSVFDELSIINVKISKTLSPPLKDKSIKNFERLAAELKVIIGEYKFNKIISEEIYEGLYETNKTIFELVDRVKTENVGKEIDFLNHKRYILKTELQKKFFESDLTEVKLGY